MNACDNHDFIVAHKSHECPACLTETKLAAIKDNVSDAIEMSKHDEPDTESIRDMLALALSDIGDIAKAIY